MADGCGRAFSLAHLTAASGLIADQDAAEMTPSSRPSQQKATGELFSTSIPA